MNTQATTPVTKLTLDTEREDRGGRATLPHGQEDYGPTAYKTLLDDRSWSHSDITTRIDEAGWADQDPAPEMPEWFQRATDEDGTEPKKVIEVSISDCTISAMLLRPRILLCPRILRHRRRPSPNDTDPSNIDANSRSL